MGRLSCCLGLVLIFVAVIAMAALVVFPVIGPLRDNPTLMSLQAAINCPAGYSFEGAFTRSDADPVPDESVDAAIGYCISPQGERTALLAEQQMSLIFLAFCVFMVPFLGGLFVGVSGFVSSRRGSVTPGSAGDLVYRRPGAVPGMGASTASGQISVTASPTLNPNLAEWQTDASSTAAPSTALSERLKQIRDAYKDGLISLDEHDRLRQAILDEKE